jgi:hypothetical protein
MKHYLKLLSPLQIPKEQRTLIKIQITTNIFLTEHIPSPSTSHSSCRQDMPQQIAFGKAIQEKFCCIMNTTADQEKFFPEIQYYND